MVEHKPVDEGRLHAQTMNNKVAEDELVELNIANETCRVSQGFFKAFPLKISRRREPLSLVGG